MIFLFLFAKIEKGVFLNNLAIFLDDKTKETLARTITKRHRETMC